MFFNKYKEKETLSEVLAYIKTTYGEHYANSNIQLIDYFDAQNVAVSYCQANAIKYIARYGKKDGMNIKDLYKAIHYIVLLIYFSSKKEKFGVAATYSPQLLLEKTIENI